MPVDIDNIATDLNGKADVDLTNTVGALSSTAKEYFSKIGMPANASIHLTLGASGTTYTAPANGYFYWGFGGGGLSYYGLVGPSMSSGWVCQAAGYGGSLCIPVKKGDVMWVNYQIAPSSGDLWFVYAQGEV